MFFNDLGDDAVNGYSIRKTMLTLRIGNVKVQFDRDGGRTFNKAGMNDWLGKPIRVLASPFNFNFDLEGRIHRIDGFPTPHSWDWLQRSMANDWIYYDKVWTHGVIPNPSAIIGDSAWPVNGRTDLPLLQGHPALQSGYVAEAFAAFDALISDIREWLRRRPEVYEESGQAPAAPEHAKRLWDFLAKAAQNDREQLQRLAERLRAIHGSMRVIPPETIHVDYRVILVKLMDGCPNACKFCMARGNTPFAIKGKSDIDRQIDALPEIYGEDLYNYNAVVFGECDALVSPFLEYAACRAFDAFRCGESHHVGSSLFLFATNKSLCQLPDSAFDMLDALPFEKVRINVGWEAATDPALARLGKQQNAAQVLEGMERAGRVNRAHRKVRISGNFILADDIPAGEIAAAIQKTRYHGTIYLSPLHGACASQSALNGFHAIRDANPGVTAYLYTMQRL